MSDKERPQTNEATMAAALAPFGWTCTDDFWQRYYSDPWVFNLAAEENANQAAFGAMEQYNATLGRALKAENALAEAVARAEKAEAVRDALSNDLATVIDQLDESNNDVAALVAERDRLREFAKRVAKSEATVCWSPVESFVADGIVGESPCGECECCELRDVAAALGSTAEATAPERETP